MKISEMIERLEELKKAKGDVEVRVDLDNNFGIYPVAGIHDAYVDGENVVEIMT